MTTTVIVGAGAAGLTCARTLRELDDERSIVVIDKDPDVPYERPPLSKALVGPDPAGTGVHELISAGIRVVFAQALSLDARAGVLHTTAGVVAYDDLVLAPGSRPQRADWTSPEIRSLHSWEDSRRLRRAVSTAQAAVVVGGGFVGAELAASLVSANVPTTLVFRERALFARRLGQAASDVLTQLHTEAGVELLAGRSVKAVHPGDPTRVVLTDGAHVEADLVIAGLGSRPDTDWLRHTGLLADDGTIQTDRCLTTTATRIKAAGDSARWAGADGRSLRSAHWSTARAHGRHIAQDLASGSETPFTEPPYFWSMQHGSLIQGIGLVDPQLEQIDVIPAAGPKPGLLVRFTIDGNTVGALAINNPHGFVAARADVERYPASALAR
ncbi:MULTISPECIES: FAD/NAD(P)-binding oxidoreductase [unclassified Leifsonia]|uniref:NAD(P)/FAD-dependent oxidoreductase n=1 Tax=unclassified Leifsonia TaxID=2663824 RepID=UPI0008A7F9CE|nr:MULTISPECIES: FAD/NAD(P)-binding oxidoreductase [unclassified Leifsonia]SEI15083.1 NADPH-dependent 2,4-dienoyl-CoA reductase, sulfur reductase [Leifsonia sp. CL154]SFM03912.1 NADPH-dependent 2,4-dienoyl-CoA reductase, sulfur reductase [Leifsonia sp. CL147]